MIKLLKNIISKPPMVFPWVAFFHVFMLVFILWLNVKNRTLIANIFPFLWIVGYTISWLGTCLLKKWAGFSYILLTIANLTLHYFLKSSTYIDLYTFNFYEVNILFSFFFLIYYRRLF